MAEGIRDKVAILGMGCTKFGERWESGYGGLPHANICALTIIGRD